MKKIAIFLIIVIFIFVGVNKIYSQNVLVSGAGEPGVDGIYIKSAPGDLINGEPYYTKPGPPPVYIYWVGGVLNEWDIGPVLGQEFPLEIYYWSWAGLLTTEWNADYGEPPAPTTTYTPLPVELSSFTAEATNQGVLCKWTTESEIENLGFILERKTEVTNWLEIASYKTDDGLLGQGTISSATEYEYLDNLVEPNTTYEYRLSDVDYNGIVTYHSTRTVTVEQAPLASMVEEFTILPAYPNPFNPSTTIKYGLDNDSKVTVAIYDIAGNLISTLVNTEQIQGWHSVIWNGTNQQGEQAPAGIYISRITSGNEVKTTKLMLLK